MMVAQHEGHKVDRSTVDGWLATLNIETGLAILIGVVAFGLRLIHLGQAPLSDAEAREALAVWRLVNGAGAVPIQPVSAAWSTLTALVFSLFGANEFWARFWPMLAGVGLVFTPLLFRRELGRAAALAACALLAISPVMLAASRTADGTTLAALGLLMAAVGARRYLAQRQARDVILAGAGLGLGLAAGPRFISALAAMLLAGLLVLLIKPEIARPLRSAWQALWAQRGLLLVAGGVAFGLLASGGLINPLGLSAAGAALPRWLSAWQPTTETRPVWLGPQLLSIYEPLLAVLGLGGLYIAFVAGYWHILVTRLQIAFAAREPDMELALAGVGGGGADVHWRGTATVLGAAVIGTLLFSVVYTGREAGDGLWVVVPLAMLAGKVLVETFSGEWFSGEWETVLAQAGVLFVMLVFVYFQLAAYGRGYPLLTQCPAAVEQFFSQADCPVTSRLFFAGGVLGLGIFVTAMFAMGWSRGAAVRGAVLALGAATLIATLGAGLGLTQWRLGDPSELWTTPVTVPEVSLLRDQLRDVSQRATGQAEAIEIAVVNTPGFDDANGWLAWELRNFPKTRFVDSAAVAKDSPLVLTNADVLDPVLGSAYVGEVFPIQARALATPPTLQNLINWWIYRTWPGEFSRRVNVWVRLDVHNLTQQP